MRTFYMTDQGGHVYSDAAQCAEADAKEKADMERWREAINTPQTKLEQLKHALDEAMNIHPGTIATCSFGSLQIKGLVRVCQSFAEENKHYLQYY